MRTATATKEKPPADQTDLDQRSGGSAADPATQNTKPPMKTGGHAPPAYMAEMMSADAGKGVSSDQADNLVPLIYILQDQSPQVLKRNPAYIENAEAGSIWLRNAPDPIVHGEEGIDVVPCYFSKDVVEWKPRDDGGGFIARHEFQAGEDIDKLAARLKAEKKVDPKNPNRFDYIMPSGNELVETRYHTVLVLREGGGVLPFVIPLSSTGHTFSRQWMFKFNSKQHNGKPTASYACVYRIKTGLKKNASGEWFGFQEDDGTWLWEKFDDPDYVTSLFLQARSLHDAFAQGLKQADVPEEGMHAATAAGTAEAERHI